MCFCASGIKKGNFYMIRLVASDIDGTLLQGGARALSDELFGLIRVLKKRGILFCAASGRQYRSMRALVAQAEDDIAYLCENGAIVYRGGSVVSKLAMERADALALIGQIPAQEQCEVLISGADTSYLIPKHPDHVDHIRYFVGNHITRVKRAQDIPEDILKVSAYCRDGAASHAQTLGAPWKAAYSVAVAGEKWLDFTRADKGTGLAALCGELGVLLPSWTLLPARISCKGPYPRCWSGTRCSVPGWRMCCENLQRGSTRYFFGLFGYWNKKITKYIKNILTLCGNEMIQ